MQGKRAVQSIDGGDDLINNRNVHDGDSSNGNKDSTDIDEAIGVKRFTPDLRDTLNGTADPPTIQKEKQLHQVRLHICSKRLGASHNKSWWYPFAL